MTENLNVTRVSDSEHEAEFELNQIKLLWLEKKGSN